MLVAKAYPGTIDAPYVADMGVTPCRTGVLESHMMADKCFCLDTSTQMPFGTSDWLVVCHCPILSLVYGGTESGVFA